MRVSVHECVCVCEYDYAVMELKCVGSVRCVCVRGRIYVGVRDLIVFLVPCHLVNKFLSYLAC